MRLLLGLILVAFSVPTVAQHAAHAHGVAELRIVVEGERLQIEFDSPLDNLVGFEHAPRTAQQREALAKAEGKLRNFDALFALPAAAGCVVRDVEVIVPYGAGAGGETPGSGVGDSHADLRTSYALECANMRALTQLRVKLIDLFPHIRRIRAEAATANGQGSATLDKSRPAMPL